VVSDRSRSSNSFAKRSNNAHASTRSPGRVFGLACAAALVMGIGCGDGDEVSSPTGGSHSGGNASGGSSAGGVGGVSGGNSNGGAALGGATVGGAAQGGTGEAGAAMAGSDSGGAGAGGEPTSTGGSGNAGAASGGAPSGGDAGSSAGGSVGTAGAVSGGAAGENSGGTASAGMAGAAGSSGSGASHVPRPQLTSEQAAEYTVLKYLEKAGSLATGLVADPWDPTAGLGDLSGITPTYRVAATGGTHTTVQAAITAAGALTSTDRVYIRVEPGSYREVVCVPPAGPPITLYGANADASQTVIVFDNYNGKPKVVDTPANPCSPNLAGATFGPSGSATFAAYANGFQAKNLSFVNEFDEIESGLTTSLQAVALMTQGDRLVFENIRVLGNQYALYVKTQNTGTASRAYFKDSYVEGDFDSIVGRGTFVLDGCQIHTLTSRLGSGDSLMVAPSTDSRNPFGILIIGSTFTAEVGTPPGHIFLGRAWDESTTLEELKNAFAGGTTHPNGQLVIRESVLGDHIRSAAPWGASTNKRPFSTVNGDYPANRLYEFANTGPGSASP
jgi:pectinesterase